MESVESIAAKIAHEDLVYLDYLPPVYQQVDRMALERSIAAALTAERTLTETANASAVNAYAKVRELEALLDGAKAAVELQRAKFAAFADEKGEPRRVLGTLPLTVEGDIIGDGAWCWFIFPGVLGKDDDKPARAMYRAMPIVDPDAYSGTRRVHSTKQAAEAAKEKQ